MTGWISGPSLSRIRAWVVVESRKARLGLATWKESSSGAERRQRVRFLFMCGTRGGSWLILYPHNPETQDRRQANSHCHFPRKLLSPQEVKKQLKKSKKVLEGKQKQLKKPSPQGASCAQEMRDKAGPGSRGSFSSRAPCSHSRPTKPTCTPLGPGQLVYRLGRGVPCCGPPAQEMHTVTGALCMPVTNCIPIWITHTPLAAVFLHVHSFSNH